MGECYQSQILGTTLGRNCCIFCCYQSRMRAMNYVISDSVIYGDYFSRNCCWFFGGYILIALYLEMKWVWHLRWLLLLLLIRLGFHLQAFSHCHWYILNDDDESPNLVSYVILLLMFSSSLTFMISYSCSMEKSKHCVNSAMYRSRYGTIVCVYVMWRLVLYTVIIHSFVKLTVLNFCLKILFTYTNSTVWFLCFERRNKPDADHIHHQQHYSRDGLMARAQCFI